MGLVVAAGLGLAAPAWAVNTTWWLDASTPGDWFDPANWDLGAPTSQDTAIVSYDRTALISGGNATAKILRLGGVDWQTPVGGRVRQTGGIAGFDTLDVQSLARYELAGGALNIRQGMTLTGTLDFDNGNATLDIGPQAIARWSAGIVTNTAGATLNIGPESLLIVPAGFNPATAFKSFNNQGLLHESGSTLVIDTGRTVRGIGALGDTEVRGTLAANSGGKIDLFGSLVVDGGQVDLGLGKYWNGLGASGSLSSGKLIATDETHNGGTRFIQSGGEHIVLKQLQATSAGNYELSGGQLTTGGTVAGKFAHTGGTHTVQGTLGVGGTYDMSGQAQLQAGELSVPGLFRQSGGTSTVGTLELSSYSTEATSIYELSGGQLTGRWETVGSVRGASLFRQTGGVHTVSSTLTLGGTRAKTHTYELSDGQLRASDLEIAYRFSDSSNGILVQSGGALSVDNLRMGTTGRFEFRGGSLAINKGLSIAGVFDLGGQDVNLSFGPATILDFGRGQLLNTQAASLHLGEDSLLVVPAGFDPAAAFRSFSNAGITHTGGTTLSLGPGRRFSGSGAINDLVEVSGGTASVPATGRLEFVGGLSVLTGGLVDAQGTLVIAGLSSQSGGSIQASRLVLTNSFEQRGGTVNATSLFTSDVYGAGVYNLIHGELRTTDAHAAYGYFGHIVQDGGVHRVSGALTVLADNDAKGIGYNLNAGRLEAARIVIGGESDDGRFYQTGGTTVAGTVNIGNGGRYLLYGGELEAAELIVDGHLSMLDAATLRVTSRMTLSRADQLQAIRGATIHLQDADFELSQLGAQSLTNLMSINLVFENDAQQWSQLEIAGQLRLDEIQAYLSNFVIGTLTVGGQTPGRLRLVDLLDNRPGVEALYVDHLVLTSGSYLDLNGLPLFYRTASIAPDATIIVPEPASLLALGAAVAAGALRRRRAC